MFQIPLYSGEGRQIELGDRGVVQIVNVSETDVVLEVSAPRECFVVRKECFERLGKPTPVGAVPKTRGPLLSTGQEVRSFRREEKQGVVIDDVCVTVKSIQGKNVALEIELQEMIDVKKN